MVLNQNCSYIVARLSRLNSGGRNPIIYFRNSLTTMSYPNKNCGTRKLFYRFVISKVLNQSLKNKIFIVTIILLSFNTQAQTNLDSLWNIWNDQNQPDTVRYKALMGYTLHGYFKTSKFDSALYFSKLAYGFAEERGLEKEMIKANSYIGEVYLNRGEYDEAREYLGRCRDLAVEINDKQNQADALQDIGTTYYLQRDHQNIIKYYKQCVPLYEELGDSSKVAKLTKYIGNSYMRLGDYYQAIVYLTKSLEINESMNEREYIIDALYYIGWVYLYQENYQEALEYFEKCRVIAEELNNKKLISMYLGGLAAVFEKTGEYNKALESYQKNLAIVKELGYLSGIAVATYNIGYTYSELEDYTKAMKYLFESLDMFKQLKFNQHIAMTQGEIGKAYLKMKNYTMATQYAEEGLSNAREIGVLKEQKDAVEVLYKAYKATNNLKKAIANLEAWWALSDSLKKEDTDNELQRYESERRRMSDSLAVVEDKLKTEWTHQETLSAERNTRNTFMFTGLGILVVAIGLFARMHYIRRTNKELAEKNKIIAKEKVRAEESEKAKEQFFDNISHEFRTPLTLIVGPLEEVLDNKIDENSRSNLQIMQCSALRLQGMINELLNLSKLEFKKICLEATEENIVDITKDYLQSFESLADQRKIKLSFQSQAATYKTFIDVEKYRKILANLLSNAIKFTDEGGEISVSVSSLQSVVYSRQSEDGAETTEDWRLKTEDLKRNGVEIKITDTGIGIPSDKLPHIFDRFYQVGEKSQTHQPGTGIGLALTKGLVGLHHGVIEVESEPGKGTTFKVFIPVGSEHLSEEEMVQKETSKPETEETKQDWAVQEDISGHVLADGIRKKSEKPLLLIVEDNPDMLAYTKSHLDKTYNILKATDGEEGLATALEQIPDLIISDVMMPKMDGNMMTKKLKTDHRTSHIPIIILTARASVDSKIEGLETGADAYVTKPFNARELKVRVKNIIEQRQRLRDHFAEELNAGQPIATSSSLPSMDHQFVQKAIDVVNNNLSDTDFDVNMFSSEMALSRTQLHRKIKALTDKTTSEFIRTIRLNKAAEMLRQKTDTVTQIAYETGFNNLSWFAKAFKEQFGMSPSEYTKSG